MCTLFSVICCHLTILSSNKMMMNRFHRLLSSHYYWILSYLESVTRFVIKKFLSKSIQFSFMTTILDEDLFNMNSTKSEGFLLTLKYELCFSIRSRLQTWFGLLLCVNCLPGGFQNEGNVKLSSVLSTCFTIKYVTF